MKLLRTIIQEHEIKDNMRFAEQAKANDQLLSELRKHNDNVAVRHQANQKDMQENKAALAQVQTSLDDIVKLRPAIEAGIEADRKEELRRKDVEYRKKLVRRVLVAVITTAVTFSGLIPLFQWLSTLHFHFGVTQ